MLTIGLPGSGMFLHADSHGTHSAALQLRGRKRWVLCDGRSPEQRPLFYAGVTMRLPPPAGSSGGAVSRRGEPQRLDAFAPDLRRFPAFAKANCSDVTLQPGEILFYPSGVWHQTMALDTPTLSVQRRVVTHSNYRAFAAQLRGKCRRPVRDLHPLWAPNLDAQNCAAVDACEALWAKWFRRGEAHPAERTAGISTSAAQGGAGNDEEAVDSWW